VDQSRDVAASVKCLKNKTWLAVAKPLCGRQGRFGLFSIMAHDELRVRRLVLPAHEESLVFILIQKRKKL
jgi:hypothetical protein